MKEKENTKKKEKSKVSYYHISLFPEFISEYKTRRLDFKLCETTYTKKIKIGRETKIFNSKGKSDNKAMLLMNKVRTDASNYLECLSICEDKNELLRETNINFYRLFKKPTIKEEIVKVDLKSAYWQYALKRGIITNGTDNTFKKLYKWSDNNIAKQARLRALGGLATQKREIDYNNGKADYDTEILNIEKTKPLYLEICRGVDELMLECKNQIEGVIYYYWDCIFVSKHFSEDAIEFFKDQKYNVNVDQDKIEFVEHKGNSYIISTKNDKCYMVREEDKNFAKWIKDQGSHFNENYLISEFH